METYWGYRMTVPRTSDTLQRGVWATLCIMAGDTQQASRSRISQLPAVCVSQTPPAVSSITGNTPPRGCSVNDRLQHHSSGTLLQRDSIASTSDFSILRRAPNYRRESTVFTNPSRDGMVVPTPLSHVISNYGGRALAQRMLKHHWCPAMTEQQHI